MEEKADRQDAISSALEGAQTRLEDAEANIAALTEELEHSARETRVSKHTSLCLRVERLLIPAAHKRSRGAEHCEDESRPTSVQLTGTRREGT